MKVEKVTLRRRIRLTNRM